MSLINRFPAASRASSLFNFDPWMQQQLSLFQRPSLFESMSSPLAVDQFQMPAFDLRETAKEFLICADVPGFSKDQISIDCEGQVLNVRGNWSKEKEQGDPKEGFWFKERARSSFQRSITLSSPFDANKISAELNAGVLQINVPKVNGGLGSKKVLIK